jgi:hypothetical protein
MIYDRSSLALTVNVIGSQMFWIGSEDSLALRFSEEEEIE